MARPTKKVDEELLKKICAIQCTWEEIESIIGVSRQTLERRYGQVIIDARNSGKMSLRRKQFEVAMAGNGTLLIWLGKQYLDQRDKVEATEIKFTDKKEAIERLRSMASKLEAEVTKENESK